MHRWRYPSLSLHGIEGAFAEAGAKTVIPRKVIGKFSIRLVPDMDPKVVEKQVMLKTKIASGNNRNICAQTIYNTVFENASHWFSFFIWDLCIRLSMFMSRLWITYKRHLMRWEAQIK